jgi:hypothetical protein
MARLFWLLIVLSSIAAPHLRPAPQKLQPWTMALRDRQPDDAFAAVYKIGRKHLVFVAAQHANRSDSLTFRVIRDAYDHFRFDTVIAEGFPTSRGPNPSRILKYVAENGPDKGGFVEGGETVPTVLGAQQQKAALWGGEADDSDVKSAVLRRGVSATDLLGFYVLRNIPQWIGEHRIDNAADPRLQALVVAALAKNRELLGVPAEVLPDFAQWSAWYERLNGKPIGASFVTEEVGPLSDGKFGTNRIAYAVSRSRDAYLHNLIISHLNADESVLVVFGGSHFAIHQPALKAVLGKPCYLGTDLAKAWAACG